MSEATATAPVAPELDDVALAAALDCWDDPAARRRRARERRLAHDLVELSRLDRGLERAELAPVDLARLLRAVTADYPGLSLDGPSAAHIETDSRRLARVLFVLLDNAQLHGVPPITLRYDEEAIVVSDEGRGFPANVLARAAEPFVTGRGSEGRGVGLSLAIARRQAALLGATLAIGNGECGGATVAVRFAGAIPTAE
jgi:signal transduction histidine kinase